MVRGGWDEGKHFGWAIEVGGTVRRQRRHPRRQAHRRHRVRPASVGPRPRPDGARRATGHGLGLHRGASRSCTGTRTSATTARLRVAHQTGFTLHGRRSGPPARTRPGAGRLDGIAPLRRPAGAPHALGRVDGDRDRAAAAAAVRRRRRPARRRDLLGRDHASLAERPAASVRRGHRTRLPRRLRVAGRDRGQGHLGGRRPRDRRAARQRRPSWTCSASIPPAARSATGPTRTPEGAAS